MSQLRSELKKRKLTSTRWWAARDPEQLVYESKICSADLPVLDCELLMPATMTIKDSTALAPF